ncbi:MAG: hypothetical protein ACF8R7_09415 [Phycisphaerales bacterium JB039]
MPEPSEPLVHLVGAAFEHAFHSIDGGDTLIPFAMIEHAGQRSLQRFVAETFEQGIANGRRLLRTSSPDRAAFAWDGFANTPEGRFDAIFIEGQDRGSPVSHIFCMRYRHARRLLRKRTIILDNCPMLMEEDEGLISA